MSGTRGQALGPHALQVFQISIEWQLCRSAHGCQSPVLKKVDRSGKSQRLTEAVGRNVGPEREVGSLGRSGELDAGLGDRTRSGRDVRGFRPLRGVFDVAFKLAARKAFRAAIDDLLSGKVGLKPPQLQMPVGHA